MNHRKTLRGVRPILLVLLLCASTSSIAHECTAKVRAASWDVTKAWNGEAQASVVFAIEGGMWMTTDWGPPSCTVLWEYEVIWVDEGGKQQSTLVTGDEKFFGKSGKARERTSETFETEVMENASFRAPYKSVPQRIVRVIVKATRTDTHL